ncbi:hypothetical protein D3C71_1322510 [compost metagenome]
MVIAINELLQVHLSLSTASVSSIQAAVIERLFAKRPASLNALSVLGRARLPEWWQCSSRIATSNPRDSSVRKPLLSHPEYSQQNRRGSLRAHPARRTKDVYCLPWIQSIPVFSELGNGLHRHIGHPRQALCRLWRFQWFCGFDPSRLSGDEIHALLRELAIEEEAA